MRSDRRSGSSQIPRNLIFDPNAYIGAKTRCEKSIRVFISFIKQIIESPEQTKFVTQLIIRRQTHGRKGRQSHGCACGTINVARLTNEQQLTADEQRAAVSEFLEWAQAEVRDNPDAQARAEAEIGIATAQEFLDKSQPRIFTGEGQGAADD